MSNNFRISRFRRALAGKNPVAIRRLVEVEITGYHDRQLSGDSVYTIQQESRTFFTRPNSTMIEMSIKVKKEFVRLGILKLNPGSAQAEDSGERQSRSCLSVENLSMAFDNELIVSNPMRRVGMLKESPSRERVHYCR